MDNKLSELSKPSAEVVSKFGDPEAFGERELKVLADIQKLAYGTKFYSQEYVSALLAELEASKQYAKERDAENESLALTVGRLRVELHNEGAANAHAYERIRELEKRLATPVRLSELCGDGENDNEYTEGLNDGINQSAKAIRAAGFKCAGDE